MSDSLLTKIERVPVDSLVPHPQNPRVGDPDLIAESLRENSQYAPLVVQRSTGHVLAGNHTLKAMKKLGWTDTDVVFVDVTDEQAVKILLSSNRTSDGSSYDNDLLLGLLAELPDLAGTGYDSTDLELLTFDVNAAEPVELPRAVESNGGVEPAAEMIVWGYLQFGTRRVTLTAIEVERLNAVHDLYLDEEGTDAGFGHKIADGLDKLYDIDSEAKAVERLNDPSRLLRAGKRGRPTLDGAVLSGLAEATGGAPGGGDVEEELDYDGPSAFDEDDTDLDDED